MKDTELGELNLYATKFIRNRIFRRMWLSAFVFWASSLAVFIMSYYKLIDPIYSVIVSIFSILQMGYAIYIIHLFHQTKQGKTIIIPSSIVVIKKGEINGILINADKEILPKNITSIHPYRNSIFRICFELDYETLPEFSVIKINELNVDTKNLSKGRKFNKENMHIFDIRVMPEEKLNFKFDKDVKLKSFSVHEIYIP